MTSHRIVPTERRPGPATVVVLLPGSTICNRVEIAVVEPHGVVYVPFASGRRLAADDPPAHLGRSLRIGWVRPEGDLWRAWPVVLADLLRLRSRAHMRRQCRATAFSSTPAEPRSLAAYRRHALRAEKRP